MVWCNTPHISPRRIAYRGWLFIHRHMPLIHTTPPHQADGWRVILYAWLPIVIVGALCMMYR